MLRNILNIIAVIIELYALLCFVRIILTWIPGVAYSPFGRTIAKICDPYLNLFRGIKWLRMGSFDFSPAVGLCLLAVLGTVLSGIGRMNPSHITVGVVLAMTLGLVWNIVSSILTFLIILIVVRLIKVFMDNREYGDGLWAQIDSSLSPLLSAITKTFTGGRHVSYRARLITGAVTLLVVVIVGNLLFTTICEKVALLPF